MSHNISLVLAGTHCLGLDRALATCSSVPHQMTRPGRIQQHDFC